MKQPISKKDDLDECFDKIEAILLEYNCKLFSEENAVYLYDKDTKDSRTLVG